MWMSREAMAQHHQEIVTGGARLLRERGIEGLSVADLMQAAGLTHGGFYRHFASKDAFVCEATDAAFGGVAGMRNAAAPDSSAGEQLAAFSDFYLSQAHCGEPGIGCPIAAMEPKRRERQWKSGSVSTQGWRGSSTGLPSVSMDQRCSAAGVLLRCSR